MKTTSSRNACECTPKQLVNVCNTLLLLLIAVMCGIVLYETYDLGKRFISFLDSSIVALDITDVDFIHSDSTSYWRNVTEDITIYSAFYDSSLPDDSALMIIGSSSVNDNYTEDLRCLIKYQGDEIRLVNVSYTQVIGHTSKFFYCFTEKEAIPYRVALMSLVNTMPTQWMKVEIINRRLNVDKIDRNVAACVKPFTENSTSVRIVSDFIEYYETIGLKQIYFYNYNASQEVVDFIRSLIFDGYSIDLLPWNKDETTKGNWHDTWSELIQDCLHRSISKFSNILIVDIWDFIVPTKYDTLPEMIENIERKYTNFTKLQIKHTNLCNGSKYRNISNKAIAEHRTFLGDILLPDVNYILQLEYFSPISPMKVITTINYELRNEILPEGEVLVYRFERTCEAPVLDYLPQKLISGVNKTNIIKNEENKTSKAFVNK